MAEKSIRISRETAYFEFLSNFETSNLQKIKAGGFDHFHAAAKINAGHPKIIFGLLLV
jgi:hypothetical protein